MSLIDTYFNHTQKYKQIYGNKTIVLMLVGSFYEVYGRIGQDEHGNKTIMCSNIEEFASICGLNISEKIKSKTVMAGFRDYIIDKYIEKLQNAGYTVVVYDQNKDDPTAEREFAGIFTPGTHFTNNNETITNNIMCIKFLNLPATQLRPKNKIIFGMATLDILTGSCNINEHEEEYFHNPSTYDELEKYYNIYNPNEMLIIFNSNKMSLDKIKDILQFIGSTSKIIRYIDLDNINDNIFGIQHPSYKDKFSLSKRAKNCENSVYKKNIISQFYNNLNSNNFNELFNMFQYNDTASHAFCFLLDYIYSHNPNLVNKIKEPQIYNSDDKLLLANHSLKQLNFLDNGLTDNNLNGINKNLKSVISFLNNCNTAMGKRRMNYTLMNPITNPDTLNKLYNTTEHFINHFKDYEFIGKNLKNIKDLEKIYRKIVLEKISPQEIFVLFDNLKLISYIYTNNSKLNNFLQNNSEQTEIFYNIQQHIDTIFNFFKLKLNDNLDDISNLDSFLTHFFTKNTFPLLDQKYQKYLEIGDIINAINFKLTDLIKSSEKKPTNKLYVSIYRTEKNGVNGIVTTKTRFKKLESIINQLNNSSITIYYKSSYDNLNKTFDFNIKNLIKESHNGNDVRIISTEINDLCYNINNYEKDFKDELIKSYKLFLNELKDMKDFFISIIEYIIYLDVLYTKSYNAITFNYCKPIIQNNNNSFVNANELRHILIEQLQSNTQYIPNDINLGIHNNNKENGFLLYGTNAVGKSSLIKALGISVILAQSGMFVPCSSFIYFPFKSIFTRILGNDNIFKGLSTFAVEMSELRTILKMSDQNSLILGDELCSGTEIDSALSIFSAGLIQLHNNNSKFIFATHFHEINEFQEIENLTNMTMKHMSVIYDKQLDKLIYDRKLKDGSGNRRYGLEVCKSLHLPQDFIDLAYNIRNKIDVKSHSISMFNKSKYNSNKLVGLCELCGKKATDIHHVKPQKDADDNGFIGFMNKNHLSNLQSLCKKCHDKFTFNK
jgi:DNA mismatch repair protein MutS